MYLQLLLKYHVSQSCNWIWLQCNQNAILCNVKTWCACWEHFCSCGFFEMANIDYLCMFYKNLLFQFFLF